MVLPAPTFGIFANSVLCNEPQHKWEMLCNSDDLHGFHSILAKIKSCLMLLVLLLDNLSTSFKDRSAKNKL